MTGALVDLFPPDVAENVAQAFCRLNAAMAGIASAPPALR